MLVIVFSSARDATESLPQSRLELYRRAIHASVQHRLPGETEAASAITMLTHAAVAAHVARLREFDGTLVATALSPELQELWERLAAEEGGLPLVKVLKLASEKGSTNSKYQAKHLSFQEGLFADALIKGTVEMPTALKDLDLKSPQTSADGSAGGTARVHLAPCACAAGRRRSRSFLRSLDFTTLPTQAQTAGLLRDANPMEPH